MKASEAAAEPCTARLSAAPPTYKMLAAVGEGAILAGPMGARPSALDGGEWTPAEMAHRGANWLRKEESLTSRKPINRPRPLGLGKMKIFLDTRGQFEDDEYSCGPQIVRLP